MEGDEKARGQWHKLNLELSPARVNCDKNDIIYPRRRLVAAESSRTREEVLTASQKAKNNPSAEEWDRQLQNMGTGHEAFDDNSWQTALGLGNDALDFSPTRSIRIISPTVTVALPN